MRTLAALLLIASTGEAVENPLPTPAPVGRYDQTLAQSPFALATKPEAPAAPQDSFAANWVLTGLSRLQDGQGAMQDFVTIRSRDQRVAFSLFGDEVSGDEEAKGVTVVKVERAEDSRKSYVMLKKGEETARVEFNQEVAAAPPQPGMPPQGALNRPGFPPVGGNVPRPGVNIQNRPPINVVRPGLPRPVAGPPIAGGGAGTVGGGAGTVGGAGAVNGQGATVNPLAGDHRRVRVIQSQVAPQPR